MLSHKSYLGQEIYIFFCKVTNSATTTITNSATTTTLSDGKFVILVLAGNMKNNDDEECQWKFATNGEFVADFV